MAVQAGCGFKPPTPVFAVPLPAPEEPPRRLDLRASPSRDVGSDVIMPGRLSGQWVTLSKALLLQLVERICQLSFQTDVTSSNTSSRLYRKSPDEFEPEIEIESFWRRSSLGERDGSPSERACDKDKRKGAAMEDCTLAEESQTPLCQDESVPTLQDYDKTISVSGETPADVRSQAVSCCDGDELDVVDGSSNVEKAPTECSATAKEAVQGPSDARTSGEEHVNDRRSRHQRRYRHQRSVSRRRLLRTRRCKKAAFATSSGGQVRRQVMARRGDDTVVGRRPTLRGVQRCRQSWMALSKDIVYGAVENELRQVDGSCRSLVPTLSGSSPAKSTAIWNPATCLSPSEKRRPRPSCIDLDRAPTLSDFPYRDVTFHRPGSDVISRSYYATSVGSSSMLSELLGFGSVTPTVVLPAEVVLTRQRRCSYNGGEATACDVISPSICSGSHSHARPATESGPSHSDVTNALNYCIRRDHNNPEEEVASAAVPRIWRPVESYPVQSTTRRVTRPRWVAVNKGDVCSLVDNLVSTMITSEDRGTGSSVTSGSGEVRDASTLDDTRQPSSASSSSCDKTAQPVTTRCSVASSEPRKWKSDLLQRMRNEYS